MSGRATVAALLVAVALAAFGAPRGWKVDDRGKGSLVRSFDRLVALSIVADRSGGGDGTARGGGADGND